MLRLPPTRIELGPKDLEAHFKRQEHRQASLQLMKLAQPSPQAASPPQPAERTRQWHSNGTSSSLDGAGEDSLAYYLNDQQRAPGPESMSPLARRFSGAMDLAPQPTDLVASSRSLERSQRGLLPTVQSPQTPLRRTRSRAPSQLHISHMAASSSPGKVAGFEPHEVSAEDVSPTASPASLSPRKTWRLSSLFGQWTRFLDANDEPPNQDNPERGNGSMSRHRHNITERSEARGLGPEGHSSEADDTIVGSAVDPLSPRKRAADRSLSRSPEGPLSNDPPWSSPDLPALPPPFSIRSRSQSIPTDLSAAATFDSVELPSSDVRPADFGRFSPRRSLVVYNDALPAERQPQTPAGLPRHGVPIMPLESGAVPATAPVGGRRVEGRRAEESPTRAGEGGRRRHGGRAAGWRPRRRRRASGQENVGEGIGQGPM